MANTAKQKIIIDCDTGVDDSVALLLALRSEHVDLLAITCVNGNCDIDQVVRNTLITLKVAKQIVPIYRGCSKPLSVTDENAIHFHSHDGLGGIAKDYAPCDQSMRSGHAVGVLLELVDQHPGEITLVALGPLTNIAMAYRMDENFSSKLKRLVIMGGNTEGKGNVKLAAEFNFGVDPVAAQIVVEETLCECQICSWELCGLNTTFSWDWFDSWTANACDEMGDFVSKVVQEFRKRKRKLSPHLGFGICDPIAVAVAIHPDIVTESVHHRVTVETAGHYTRGMMVIEWIKGLFPRQTKAVELILKVDRTKYDILLESVIKRP